jgi:hypothetical protein
VRDRVDAAMISCNLAKNDLGSSERLGSRQ